MMEQALQTVMFYVITTLITLLACAVVFGRKLLRAAVSLMFVLILTGGLYVMMGAEFIAGVQVLVYVGGIVVLIVFAVMLTRTRDLLEDHPTPLRLTMGLIAWALFLFAACCAIFKEYQGANVMGTTKVQDDVGMIGRALLDYGSTGYVLPFEIISLLLLAAVIGGVVVARKIPAPGQPFTSGGDLPGEVHYTQPRSQREENV